MPVVVLLLTTSILHWPLSVALSFDLKSWFICRTLHFMVVNDCIKLYYNACSDILPTKSGYFIISCDLCHACIDHDNACKKSLIFVNIFQCNTSILIFQSDLWSLCDLTMVNMCPMQQLDFTIHLVLLRTSIFFWPLSVTWTFDL
jgi:hypothetical protein